MQLDRTTPDAFERFKSAMLAHDEVMDCHMVAGGFDYLLKVRVRNMEATAASSKASRTVRGVQQTHTYFVMEEVKSTHAAAACRGTRVPEFGFLRWNPLRHRPDSTSRHRLREILDILLAQSRDVHAAVVGHVDVMLLAQRLHLRRVTPRNENMPLLPRDEAEVPLRAGSARAASRARRASR